MCLQLLPIIKFKNSAADKHRSSENTKGDLTMDCVTIWNELQEAIRTAVGAEVSYKVHIKPAEAVMFEDSVFVIAVPSTINQNVIEFRFRDKIESILEAHTGQKVTLKIILESERKQFEADMNENNEES